MNHHRRPIHTALTLAILAAVPRVAAQEATTSVDSLGGALFQAMSSRACVQTFRVDGAQIVTDAEAVNIAGYKLVALGPIPAHSDIDSLRQFVARARRAKCALPRPCEFLPRYAFRYFDSSPPLDLLISEDCLSFKFTRGKAVVSAFEFCDEPLALALERVMLHVFQGAPRR